jgi:hypothetical protein
VIWGLSSGAEPKDFRVVGQFARPAAEAALILPVYGATEVAPFQDKFKPTPDFR